MAILLQVYFDLGRDVASGPGWWQPANWWSAAGILVPSAYAYGTDTTTSGGPVPTSNDLALIWLKPMNESDIQVGDLGGWFSYAVNGWGFSAPSAAMGLGAPTAPASSQVTVLGYPLAFDLADRMQISNSAAYFMQLTVKRNPRGVKNLIRWAGGCMHHCNVLHALWGLGFESLSVPGSKTHSYMAGPK